MYHWDYFTVRININAPVQGVYDLWTTQEGMESWFLSRALFFRTGDQIPANEDLHPGDTYRWNWHGYSDDVVETGEVLDANGADYLRFVFGKAGTVSVKIFEEQGETIVELKQENIPTDDESRGNYHVGCSTGWTFYLANLKSILEGGVDLRNKNLELKRMVNS